MFTNKNKLIGFIALIVVVVLVASAAIALIADSQLKQNAAQTNAELPWEKGGKRPDEYTLEEYEALSAFEQDAFFESFDSVDDFDRWMTRVYGNEVIPWEDPGAKQPNEYTWEEYEALSEAMKKYKPIM